MTVVKVNSFAAMRRELSLQGWSLVCADSFADDVREAVAILGGELGDIRNLGEPEPIWEVRVRGTVGSFSETNAAGYYHTDCQYAQPSPRYLVLGCVRPASDGGDSRVISFSQARFEELRNSLGTHCFAKLHDARWQWLVPSALRKYVDYDVSSPSPVLTPDGYVRWKRLSLVNKSPLDKELADRFEEWLDSVVPDLDYRLREGDVLVTDNWRTVHGRTSFSDTERLLLRARVQSLLRTNT